MLFWMRISSSRLTTSVSTFMPMSLARCTSSELSIRSRSTSFCASATLSSNLIRSAVVTVLLRFRRAVALRRDPDRPRVITSLLTRATTSSMITPLVWLLRSAGTPASSKHADAANNPSFCNHCCIQRCLRHFSSPPSSGSNTFRIASAAPSGPVPSVTRQHAAGIQAHALLLTHQAHQPFRTAPACCG